MSQHPIIIVDYGAGNLRSVARALAQIGEEPLVTADPRALDEAGGVILPGVGAAQDTMSNLRERGFVDHLRRYIESGRPFMGVCMGLQALFEWSEEGGGQECLGVIPGKIRHFSARISGLKVPHMGWNTVHWTRPHPINEGIAEASYFYFVHSFYPEPASPEVVVGKTEYGVPFASVIGQGNVVATQFHPEKSGPAGLRLYTNFCRWARCGRARETAPTHG